MAAPAAAAALVWGYRAYRVYTAHEGRKPLSKPPKPWRRLVTARRKFKPFLRT